MNSRHDLTFVSFQSLRNNIPTGMVKFMLPLFERMNLTNDVIYLVGDSRNNGDRYTNVKFLSILYFYFSKVISKFFPEQIFTRLGCSKRFVLEEIFDLTLSIKLRRPQTIVSSAYVHRTFNKNKKLGGKNVFIAGNPCDSAIYDILVAMQDKFSVKVVDAYTDTKRLSAVSNTYDLADEIVIFTRSQLNTFEKKYAAERLFYKETFILPNKETFVSNHNISKSDKFTYCYIAHSVWLKGLTFLLDAWSELELHDSQLNIAGTINDDLWAYISKKYNNLKNVHFVGPVSDLNKFYRESHVCVVPSLLDAGPATVAEALLCGLPVICTSSCGSASLIKDNFGLVVEAANVSSLSSAMLSLRNNFENYKFSDSELDENFNQFNINDFYNVLAKHLVTKCEVSS